MDAKELADDLRKDLKGMLEARDKKSDDLAEQIEHLKTKSDEDSTDIKTRLDGTKSDIEDISEKIEAHEKKMARLFSLDEERKSAGTQFIESEGFKSRASTTQPFSYSMETKDITNAGNVQGGVSRSIMVPEQEAGYIPPLEQEFRIRSLIPAGQTTSNTIRYTSENVFTNNAAQVAEGAAKPQSEITFSEQTVPVQKMAHKFVLSMEILEDAPRIRSIVDGRGRYGLNLHEETQLLTGDYPTGSGNLKGLLPNATAYNNTAISGFTPATVVDDIRVAKLQVRDALLPASGVVMNPATWAGIEVLKDTDGNYLYSSVQTGQVPRLWGLPVVVSDSMEDGDFLVGAFSMGAQIWDRMGMTVMMSTEDGNNFSENKVTMLFEKRLALEITRPQAFVWKNAVV